MLIALNVGGVPTSETVPVISPTVDGSIVAEPPAGAGTVSDSGASFLLQPAIVITSADVITRLFIRLLFRLRLRQIFIVKLILLVNSKSIL
jgi:hypothetical protein